MKKLILIFALAGFCVSGQESNVVVKLDAGKSTNVFDTSSGDLVTVEAEPAKRVLPIPWADSIAAIVGFLLLIWKSWQKRAAEQLADRVAGVLTDNVDTARAVIRKLSANEETKFVSKIQQEQINAGEGVREEIVEHRDAERAKEDPAAVHK